MSGFLDQFRKNVFQSVWKEDACPLKSDSIELDDKIALGVLLWIVAEADKEFKEEEQQAIETVLREYCHISDEQISVVLRSIETAARERIDLFQFTHEVKDGLPRDKRIEIMEQLFRVACADKNLDESENSVIRKIAGLFGLDHQEYIDAKLKIKQEFGLGSA